MIRSFPPTGSSTWNISPTCPPIVTCATPPGAACHPACSPRFPAICSPLQPCCRQPRIPSLIHADLTRDHLLGEHQDGDWALRAIIDFGDALSGDLFYELVVLHLEIFNADLCLLREFLAAYQPSPFHQQDFTRKAMTLTLLHPYDAFATVFARHPDLRQSTSLDELADRLWNVNTSNFSIVR